MSPRILTYGIAALLGLVAVGLAMPLDALLGGGASWAQPSPDIAQSLTGHLAFQYDAWRWPLLDARTLFWPRGVSIALTDSNPIFSLVAKLWISIFGGQAFNLLGAWIATYWLLQPIAAVYAARGLRLGPLPCTAVAILSLCWPALLFRVGHINLCGHFVILFALGLVFRRSAMTPDRGMLRRWRAPAALLLVAVLLQPYLYLLAAALLAAIPLHGLLARNRAWRSDAIGYVASAALAAVILTLLSGPLGGGDKGFVFFSMNVLSPIWPQLSGVFGADLKVIDATGGQYEGYNWLGAGVLLLLIAALATLPFRRPALRPWRAFIVVCVGLTLLALSSHIYVGRYKVLDLGVKPWEDVFAVFRSSGRAFWPVGYAIMLFSVAAVARLPRPVAAPLLVVACILQFIDTGPLRANERANWTRGTDVSAPMLPGATTLLMVAPYPGCSKEFVIRAGEEAMLLDGARRHARLGEIGLGRPPVWFSCEMFPADALELPMEKGEVRAFFGVEMRARFRPDLLGAGVECSDTKPAIICAREAGTLEGERMKLPEPRAPLALPHAFAGRDLAGVLGAGWKQSADGIAWSEGPYNTLVMKLPADTGATVTLMLAGIATQQGGTRDVTVTAGRTPIATLALADGRTQDVVLRVNRSEMPDGLLRLAFSSFRPVDPKRRGIAAPVDRVALRIDAIGIRSE